MKEDTGPDCNALLISLGATQGFYTLPQVFEVVGKLQEKGISAVCFPSPGAPLEGLSAFQIWVPEEQIVEAKSALDEIFG